MFLMSTNFLSVFHDLGGGGNQGQELDEPRTKLIDIVDTEKIVGLGFLGETSPVQNQ